MGQEKGSVRLAYVVSHPIQYQANLLRRIAAEPGIDLMVFFCSDFSLRAYADKGFGVDVEWDLPLTDGYPSTVLSRWRDTTEPSPTRPIAHGFFRHFRRGLHGAPFDAVWLHGYSTVNSAHAMLAAKALGLPVLVRTDSWLGERQRTKLKLASKRVFFSPSPMLSGRRSGGGFTQRGVLAPLPGQSRSGLRHALCGGQRLLR